MIAYFEWRHVVQCRRARATLRQAESSLKENRAKMSLPVTEVLELHRLFTLQHSMGDLILNNGICMQLSLGF